MGTATAEVLDIPNNRAVFAERIAAAWHKSREKIIALGLALIEAKRGLAHGEFTLMIENDLPFGPDNARRFMRIAADPRFAKHATSHVLPETVNAMDTLQRLTDEQFETAIARGAITNDMTVKQARELVSSFDQQAASFSWDTAVDRTPPQHRPNAAKMGAPVEPKGQGATCYHELVWLLIERRKALSMSQLDLDARAGWTDGYASKLEIPHADDGRTASWESMQTWLAALGTSVSLI